MDLSSPTSDKLIIFLSKNFYILFSSLEFFLSESSLSKLSEFSLSKSSEQISMSSVIKHIYILLKTLGDNSFSFFYELNQSILLINKFIESLLLVLYYCENLCLFLLIQNLSIVKIQCG